MAETPYLSIVAVSRNDGHGGNITRRMQLFVQGLLEQTRRFKLPAELLMVEWNPPEGKPLLHEILPKPGPEDVLTIRYIIVPPEIHAKFRRGDVVPLFQMIGKNVGIRRAKGEYILCTNIDLIFSDELVRFMADRKLNGKQFYRANRVDVPDEIDPAWPIDQQLEYASNHVLRRLGKDPQYMYLRGVSPWIYNYKLLARALNWAMGFLLRRLEKPYAKFKFNLLDSSACGDFTLMSKEAWIDIQGYLELDLYSIHIDTFGIVAAASLGYEQVVLPPSHCAYHIDHPLGWEAMTPIEKVKFVEERPGLGFDLLWETAMQALDKPMRFDANPEDWGYANAEFEEHVFVGGKA